MPPATAPAAAGSIAVKAITGTCAFQGLTSRSGNRVTRSAIAAAIDAPSMGLACRAANHSAIAVPSRLITRAATFSPVVLVPASLWKGAMRKK